MTYDDLPDRWRKWRAARIQELVDDDGMDPAAAAKFADVELTWRHGIEGMVGFENALAAALKDVQTPFGKVLVFLDLESISIPPEHRARAESMTADNQRVIRSACTH